MKKTLLLTLLGDDWRRRKQLRDGSSSPAELAFSHLRFCSGVSDTLAEREREPAKHAAQ
jgi:hypothetical protein